MGYRIPRVAAEGIGIISVSAVLCVLSAVFGNDLLFYLFLLTTAFLLFFFRDPHRDLPKAGDSHVISPADGKVVEVSEAFETCHLKTDTKKISVFLSIFDCHITRSPVSGKVAGTIYTPGKFDLAFRESSSDSNERLSTLIELEDGVRVVLVHVAGFIARRIVSGVKYGDPLESGQRVGIIKFGSRMDIYLPLDVDVKVRVGDRVTAGSTVIALLP